MNLADVAGNAADVGSLETQLGNFASLSSKPGVVSNVIAGRNLQAFYRSSSGSASWKKRWIETWPTRVSQA
jgi:hypothetical protein